MRILVLNSGSSSIKYRLFDMADESVLAAGLVERIGGEASRLRHRTSGEPSDHEETRPIPTHRVGLETLFDRLESDGCVGGGAPLGGVGHRVVHGGERFREPVLIDPTVVAAIRELAPLAPLHNPANLLGIEVMAELMPAVAQVAVFDTAFHQTLPEHAFRYAIPQTLYERYGVRRYGFHGTSHAYVAKQAALHLGRPLETLNLITLHLGNGASAAAIEAGRCVDTSMGLTPLEGLVMGTRSGDIDPAIVFYLARAAGLSLDRLDELLNKDSGLEGLCGSNDMREVHRRAEVGDGAARLALEMFAYRIRKYLGAYLAVLGHVDAVVFTAGIGENDQTMRQRACAGLEHLGIVVDEQRNGASAPGIHEIQPAGAPVKVLVVPTNEELEIARGTAEHIRAATGAPGG